MDPNEYKTNIPDTQYYFYRDVLHRQRKGFLLSRPEDNKTYYWLTYKNGGGYLNIYLKNGQFLKILDTHLDDILSVLNEFKENLVKSEIQK